MFERAVELREEIKEFVKEDGMQFTEKVVDMMVDEFGERLESEETENNAPIARDSITYKRILAEAVEDVCVRIRDIEFKEVRYDSVEDDYSEESNAEFNLVK